MKRLSLLFIFIIAFALASPVASAFTVTADTTIADTCPSHFVVFNYHITNTGGFADTFTVSKGGSAADWALVSPSGFVLQPDEAINVLAYVTPSSRAATGSYTLDLDFSGQSSGTQRASSTIMVNECHTLGIGSNTASQTVCMSEIIEYSLTVANGGIWTENVELKVSGNGAQFATLSSELMRLEPGESRLLTLFVSAPIGYEGEYELTVTASSLESNAVTSVPLELIIDGCFGFSMDVDENYVSFCENSEAKLPITISNTGSSSDSYTLSLDGPEWAALSRTSVNLGGQSSQIIELVLFPGYNIAGNFPVSITASSQQGQQEATLTMTSNVLTCHGVDISVSQQSDTLCPRTHQQYDVSIMNTGADRERFTVRVSGANWAELSGNFMELGPQESADLILTVAPDSEAFTAQHTLTITAESQESSSVTDSDFIDIEIAPRESCFGIRATAEQDSISVAYGEGALVPIVIENLGSEEATYELDASGAGASFVQLNPSSVTIEGNNAETVYLYISVPDQTELGSYSVIVSARQEDGALSSSTTLVMRVVDDVSLLPEIPEQDEDKPFFAGLALPNFGEWFEGMKGRVTGAVAGTMTQAENFTPSITVPESISEPLEPIMPYLADYWYVIVIVIVILLLLIIIWQFVISSLEEEEIIIEEAVEPKEKKPGLLGKFSDWLAEDEEIVLEDDKPSKESSVWEGVVKWIEEEDAEPKRKPARRKKEPGVWDKFNTWLEEEEPDQKPKRKPSKKKEQGSWGKFTEWLEEEEPETKVTISAPKKVVKKPAKKPAKRQGKKDQSAWDKFTEWLEEE